MRRWRRLLVDGEVPRTEPRPRPSPRSNPIRSNPEPVTTVLPSLARRIEAARPSGRLPVLDTNRKSPKDERARVAERWKTLVSATKPPPRPTKDIFEPSRYYERDERDDDEDGTLSRHEDEDSR